MSWFRSRLPSRVSLLDTRWRFLLFLLSTSPLVDAQCREGKVEGMSRALLLGYIADLLMLSFETANAGRSLSPHDIVRFGMVRYFLQWEHTELAELSLIGKMRKRRAPNHGATRTYGGGGGAV